MSTQWPPEQIELLKVLTAKHFSAADIAKRINVQFGTRYSRSAILGKMHREGFRKSSIVSVKKWARPAKLRPAAPANDLPVVTIQADADIVGVPFAEIGNGKCRWPIGDPRDSEFRCCGAVIGAEETYCAAHSARAYIARRFTDAEYLEA